MHGEAGATRRRILRVREAQRQIALGRRAAAARAVAEIDQRRDLVARLVDDTLPLARSYDGIDFIGRIRFVQRMGVAQGSLGQARIEAVAANADSIADLKRADSNVEIATRMLAAETARRLVATQRRALEDLSRPAKPPGRGADR